MHGTNGLINVVYGPTYVDLPVSFIGGIKQLPLIAGFCKGPCFHIGHKLGCKRDPAPGSTLSIKGGSTVGRAQTNTVFVGVEG